MSTEDSLYSFLTRKLRELAIPVESLPLLLGVSRSTLYRNMKGTVQMSAEVQGKFADILKLNDIDRQEYDSLSSLVAFDPTLVEARSVIDRFVFSNGTVKAPVEPIRFALYEHDTFLRSSSQIFEQIIKAATADGVTATVRIVNCATQELFSVVADFVESLLTQTSNATVEHLLTLPLSDYAVMAGIYTQLVPLVHHNDYTVHYASMPTGDGRRPITPGGAQQIAPLCLDESMSIAIKHNGTTTLYLLAFLPGDLSSCLVTRDPSVIEFLHSNYAAIKRHYSAALVDNSNLDPFQDTLANLEEHANKYLIKANFCYDRIPTSVFDSMLSRMAPDDLALLQSSLAGPGGDPDTIVPMIVGTLERRARASFANRHTDVYSIAGLEEFARTGRTSDHLEVMPAFSPEERRTILTNIQERVNDPQDSYTLYVTRDNVLPDGSIIVALEGKGVYIQYNADDYRRGVLNNLYLNNPALATVFADYVTNVIPQIHALSPEETNNLLTSLIESTYSAE